MTPIRQLFVYCSVNDQDEECYLSDDDGTPLIYTNEDELLAKKQVQKIAKSIGKQVVLRRFFVCINPVEVFEP